MNRNQGFAATAFVLAGTMFRGGLPTSLSGNQPKPADHQQTSITQRVAVSGEGPWKASCNYWRAGRSNVDAASDSATNNAKPLPELKVALAQSGEQFNAKGGPPAPAPDKACGSDGWGIPDTVLNGKPDSGITALIATVPDPIHSSMPLEFDRAIETLSQAASQYGYVSSYFWLPWHRPSTESAKSEGTGGGQSRDDIERETQPGLLILKQSRAIPFSEAQPSQKFSRERLIYLFLVGQSPALGLNSDQMQNALTYEGRLLHDHHARLSFRNGREADVIGPNSSGTAASLRAALDSHPELGDTYTVAGITSTQVATKVLNSADPHHAPQIHYFSFGDNSMTERKALVQGFTSVNPDGETRLAILVESGTVFGQSEAQNTDPAADPRQTPKSPLVIPFPRDIGLLRNASSDSGQSPESAAAAGFSPYLHFSLKDSSGEDNIPPFASQVYTFSQEAQWMAIAREMKNHRINVVAVSASNVLDALFLIKSINRDIPDIQVVVYAGGDLLFSRIGDNDPYIGAITLSPYPLTDLSPVHGSPDLYNFPDALSEALFNAAAYIFWDPAQSPEPHLADYRNPFLDNHLTHPALWATVVGRDGYYPLAILDSCPSNEVHILPSASVLESPSAQLVPCTSNRATENNWSPKRQSESGNEVPAVSPGFTWYFLCICIMLLCTVHGIGLLTASFWSPATHDLAIKDSDQPRRRSVYVNISAAVLVAMSFVASFPVFPAWHLLHASRYTALTAIVTLLSGLFSAATTLAKTHKFLGRARPRPTTRDADFLTARKQAVKDMEAEAAFYPLFNLIALATAIVVPLFWVRLCVRNHIKDVPSVDLGVFFSYRCLFPASGVCPLLPVILILATWYIWAHVQTKRLRFSENRRPMLPGKLRIDLPHFYYVADEELSCCSSPLDSCLYEKINCLLITRQLMRRSLSGRIRFLNPLLIVVYALLFLVFIVFARIYGLDHFLSDPGRFPGPYEILICGMFFPLLVIAITGCLRMMVIWAALNRGLLEPLERSPLRFAFSRMDGVNWMTMLRQSGVYEYWRDMTRSMESMQQLLANEKLQTALHSEPGNTPTLAEEAEADLNTHLATLWTAIRPELVASRTLTSRETRQQAEFAKTFKDLCPQLVPPAEPTTLAVEKPENYLLGEDLPDKFKCAYLNLMCAVECDFADFAQSLITAVLAPYWRCKRKVLVGNDPIAAPGDTHGSKELEGDVPLEVRMAEEFLAIRYISLIRAVLINLRYLITFVSTAFVLALLAWNSYPFQPRQWVDWTFTLLLFGIGAGVVGVYAQMHRSPILSRITGTTANELGGDFFIRLLTFGTVPFLTWIASQFPAISSMISRLLQSGLSPAK